MTFVYRALLASTSLAMLPTSALAQTEAAARPAETPAGDIVVTAERRSTSVQRTPQLIQAVTGEALARANISDVSALQTIVPNFQIIEIGAQPSAYIRGVGSNVATSRADPAVGYNIDGIPIVRPLSINGGFYDLDRVEVLKGPQGTLYGRNATVGAVNVISRKPTFDSIGGELSVSGGNYGRFQSEGAVNVPLTDNLAIRASFQTLRHDGYLTTGANDADNVAGRLVALWKPSSTVSVLAFAHYYKDTGHGTGDVPLTSATGSFLDPANPWAVKVGPLNNKDTVPEDARQNLRTLVVGGQVDVDLGFAQATILPGYATTQYRALNYDGGFLQHLDTPDRQVSVEARLASQAGGPFKWIVGGIYLDDHQSGIDDLGITLGSLSRIGFGKFDLASYAFFAQGTYALTPGLRLVGGIRYSHDIKVMDGYLQTVSPSYAPLGSQTGIFGHQTYNNVSYKAGVEYDVASAHLLYANIATGYKAGSFNPGTPPNTYAPETITAYAVGSKNTFMGNRVTLNIEAWWWNYNNVNQVQFGLLNPFPNVQLVTYNASKVVSRGVEAQASVLIGAGGRLSISPAYTDSFYRSFSLPAFVFGPFNLPATDYSGQASQVSPKWSADVGYQQTVPLPHDAALVASVSSHLKTSERIIVQPIPGSTVPATSTTDLTLTYQAPRHVWEVEAWVKNIENTPVLYFGGVTPAGLWGHPGPPRTYGLSARARF